MVVDGAAAGSGGTDDTVDRLFHALADATRRDMLRRCARGELSVSRLAAAYPMSFAAVQKHVAVLERAGLVTKRRRGRERLVRTDPGAVGRARQALDELESAWRARVDRMSGLLPDAAAAGPGGGAATRTTDTAGAAEAAGETDTTGTTDTTKGPDG